MNKVINLRMTGYYICCPVYIQKQHQMFSEIVKGKVQRVLWWSAMKADRVLDEIYWIPSTSSMGRAIPRLSTFGSFPATNIQNMARTVVSSGNAQRNSLGARKGKPPRPGCGPVSPQKPGHSLRHPDTPASWKAQLHRYLTHAFFKTTAYLIKYRIGYERLWAISLHLLLFWMLPVSTGWEDRKRIWVLSHTPRKARCIT